MLTPPSVGFRVTHAQMGLAMMIAFTYLPGFVTASFQGMPGMWKSYQRLMLCWLVFMQALDPGRKTWQELFRWTPTTVTAWRFEGVNHLAGVSYNVRIKNTSSCETPQSRAIRLDERSRYTYKNLQLTPSEMPYLVEFEARWEKRLTL